MKQYTWPKAYAYLGLTVMGLVLAYYSTSIANGGIASKIMGSDPDAGLLTMGAASMIVGLAVAAVFGYLALVQIRSLTRKP
jgi:hypothetical protein